MSCWFGFGFETFSWKPLLKDISMSWLWLVKICCNHFWLLSVRPSFQIEIKLVCHLTTRQRWLYQAVKNKISIDDLVYTSTSSSSTNATTSSLMNLVMQFRKVRDNLRSYTPSLSSSFFALLLLFFLPFQEKKRLITG